MKLLLFTASWCIPCRQYIPRVWDLKDKYDIRNFMMVDVEHKDKLEPPNDPDLIKIAKAYRVISVPTLLFIADTGEILGVIRDAVNFETLEDKYLSLCP